MANFIKMGQKNFIKMVNFFKMVHNKEEVRKKERKKERKKGKRRARGRDGRKRSRGGTIHHIPYDTIRYDTILQ